MRRRPPPSPLRVTSLRCSLLCRRNRRRQQQRRCSTKFDWQRDWIRKESVRGRARARGRSSWIGARSKAEDDQDEREDPRNLRASFLSVVSPSVPATEVVKTWLASAVSVALLYVSIPKFGVLTSRLGQGDLRGLLEVSLSLSLLIFGRTALLYIQDVLGWKCALKTVDRLRERAFVSLLAQDAESFSQQVKRNDLSHRLTFEVEKSALLVHAFIQRFVPGVLQIVGMVCRMLTLAPLLTAATLLIVPFMGLLATTLGEWVRRMSSSDIQASSELSTHISEVFTMFEFVIMYSALSFELSRFRKLSDSFLGKRIRTENARALLPVLMTGIYTITIIFLFATSCWLIGKNAMSSQNVVAFCTTLIFLMEPIQGVSAAFNEMKQNQASFDRLLELVRIGKETRSGTQQSVDLKLGKEKKSFDIKVEDVSFGYVGSDESGGVLGGCSLSIPHGKKIGIMGLSGSGKSTLGKLIAGLYKPQEGVVKIAGLDTSAISQDELSGLVTLVPQELPLIEGTIEENVRYGLQRENVSLEEVEDVCKAVEIHNDIVNLKDGYASPISGFRSNFSGGQKQRLAIARALLRKPEILILDEALVALDIQTAEKVQQSIERYMSGRTLIYVAHQLETISNVDYLYIMENGQMIEEGKPARLAKDSRIFANILEVSNERKEIPHL